MNIRWRVELSQSEREELTALLSGGKPAVRKVKRAQILLAADDRASDGDIQGHEDPPEVRRRPCLDPKPLQ